jgi:methionine-rich copper-binding protein CopC
MFSKLWKQSIFVSSKKEFRSAKRIKPPRVTLALEWLESRELLSFATPDFIIASTQHATTTAPSGAHPDAPPPSSPPGFSPGQIQNIYGFNQISFASYTGSTLPGAGETIAIVDAYNDPNIASDLKVFDQQFGLSNPNLTVVNQNGGSTLPGTDPTAGWEVEESLDVEWAHAIAPGANIVLVEANSASFSNLLTAVTTAATKMGASVVSMSWGGNEFSSETGSDSHFTASGVTYVASSGDSGSPAGYPSTSPNVLSVGGTSLTLNSSGGYGSEAVWNDSFGSTGGGISAYESLPSYQVAAVTNNSNIPGGTPTKRSTPDVAYDADPATGFAVYDTYRESGWFEVGGTSDAAPQWAALVAIADQGRAQQGLGSLSGASQTLPMLYQMPSSNYHDTTSGSNGTYPAGPGYDLVTGRGTPIANQVINYLVSGSSSPPSLMAAYNFAQGSGSVLTDVSGNGNNGTITNATWTSVNSSGLPFTSALQFTGGNNSFVTIANSASLDLTTGMTLEAWVDPTAAANGWQDVMYKPHDNYYLEASSPGSVPAAGGTAGSSDTGPSGKTPLPLNTWSFLAATYNGTNMILYVNGVQVSSVAVSGNLATSTNSLQIGGDSTYSQYFQGLISNVRIYNTALSQSAIQADMNTAIGSSSGTPPTVTSVTPANNASNVSTSTSVTVQFSEALAPATVTSSTIQLLDSSGNAVAASVSYNSSTNTATLTPSTTLSSGNAYTVVVHGGSSGPVIESSAYNPLAANFSSSFTTTTTISGPVAAYNFAQGSGSVLTDISGNGNDGTVSNATWTSVNSSSLPFTSALQFTGGNNSFVTIANSASLDLTTGMTLEAWVDPTATANAWQDAIYKARDNYYLEAASPGGAPAAGGTAGSADTTLFGAKPLPTNTWSFLSETYNGSTLIFYVNGVQVASKVLSGDLVTSTNSLQIGGDSIYGQYFQGLISNVRIYNSALSQSAIQTDMTSPIGSSSGTPPTVTSVTPADNATNVSTGTAVTVQFSEALAPATVTSSTIQLLNSSGSVVSASATYNSSTDTATLTPNAALAASSTYTVMVHGGSSGPVIESSAYNPLAANFSSSFTTAASLSGLVAAYNFAQGSGSVLTDLSGNGDNGTISNANWTTVNSSSLPFTGALQFAGGNNSLVTIANSETLNLTTGFTLEAWVDPTAAANGWQDMIYKARDNYYLEAASPGGAPAAGGTVGSVDTTLFGASALPTNTWSFLAATYNGTNMILYVNGVQVASVAARGNLATSTNPLQIGGDSIYGQYFQGLISNIRIYNTALSQSAIQTDMDTAIE